MNQPLHVILFSRSRVQRCEFGFAKCYKLATQNSLPLYYKSLITNISCYYVVSLLSVSSHFVCGKMNIKFFSTILVRYKYAQISIMEQFHLSPLPFYKFSA